MYLIALSNKVLQCTSAIFPTKNALIDTFGRHLSGLNILCRLALCVVMLHKQWVEILPQNTAAGHYDTSEGSATLQSANSFVAQLNPAKPVFWDSRQFCTPRTAPTQQLGILCRTLCKVSRLQALEVKTS